MNKNIILLIVLLIGIGLPIYSQTQADNLKVVSERIVRKDNQVYLVMDFVLDEMNIQKNDMVILNPILKSNATNDEMLSLPPIVITGKLRDKIVARKEKLGNQKQLPFKDKPQTIVKRENNTSQSVNYKVSVPYSEWMSNASLTIEKNISGCADCSRDAGEQLILQNILPIPDPASYKLTYLMPKVEPAKEQINRDTVTFSYPVDSYELLRDYKNNSCEFARVEKILEEIKNNKDIETTEFLIVGYVSPEGKSEHNRILAENRANSFANYLITELGISHDKLTVEGKGEDWAGLHKIVSESDLNDKHNILNIIDTEQNLDIRDMQLKRLSKGNTYKALLRDYYPQLRRTEYIITYVVRAFDIEEAKQIIKTNPEQLSLNEMYLIAENYSPNSKEFKEVFDIIAQLYPDNEIAIVNSAASDIENKNYDQAIDRLKKIEDNPITWNNLGVAYALKNDTQRASEYFKRAMNNIEAEVNLRIIQGMNLSN